MIFVGIDPGLNGGISFIADDGSATVEDMPTVALPGTGLVRRRVDGRGLADVLRAGVPADQRCLVFVEMVRAMGGEKSRTNSIQAQASLTRTLGAIEAVLDVMRIKPYMVEPQTWKRFYKLGKEKPEAMKIARKLFPSIAKTRLARVGDHNRAEACLIANWGMRKLS